MRAMTDDKLHSADRFTRALRSVHAERGPRSSCRMRTEQKPPARSPENTMNQARGESETSRKNGYLPAGVVHVSKEELRRFLKCKRVGNYLLGKNIGEGSFARVKQGFHVLTGERVAVKIIDKKQAQKDKYVAKNMRREAKILQMVCHPNVVQLLEVVETENRYYLVTELAAGGDLMDYICYRRKLGEVEVRKFIRQIVSAVHYLHRGGILHRDLKVENLLLDEDYNIKIIDFGLSNTIYGPTSEGQTMKDHCQTQCGSPAYAAPEILGHKQYGPQVDVWSIGVNMYAMLTGKLPYTAEPFHITTLYNKMKTGDMNEVPEHLSRGCKDLIHKFLTFHPEERITLEEALNHEWLCKEQRPQSTPITFPNYLSEEVMDEDIVNHMVEKMQFKRLETIEAVIHNRPTPASCVYHLLSKKLKKYIEKHPDRDVKIRKTVKVESSPLPSRLPVAKRSQTTSEGSKGKHFNETSNRTTSHEKVVAERVYVEDENQPEVPDCSKLSVNDVEHSEKANSNSSALEVEAFVVFQSSMALSSEKENSIETPRTTIVTPCVEPEKEKSTALETPRTIDGSSCSIASNASEENSRGRANSASCELITINRRKASQNLSQISVETRSTNGPRDPLKNTSISICSERGDSTELLSSGTSSKVSSDRRDDEAPMAEDSLNSSRARSYSCNGTSVPAMVLVEPVNAKVVSIPKSLRRRSESFDQTPHSARMSLPHPKKHSESSTNRPHGGALRNHSSDCAVRQSTSEEKSPPVGISRINRVSVASIAPYGLCCQVIRLSNSDMHSGGEMHDGQRARNRRKTFSLGRRLSGDTARKDTDVENPRQIGRAATQRLSTTTQNGAELSNSLDRSSGSTARAHDQECEQQSLPFKMRLPLTRKSADDVQEWRRCLRQETNGSRDETTDNRRRKSTGQRTGETGPAENCTVASSRRRNRIGVSKGVSLPPAPGASPPDSYSKQIMNEVLDLARESPRKRLNRGMTTEPKDRRHVPDADYVSRLSQLRRSRQNDKERRPLVQRGDHEEKDRRRFSEPNARVHSSVSPPLLTSPRGAVIKLTHRPTRGRNQ